MLREKGSKENAREVEKSRKTGMRSLAEMEHENVGPVSERRGQGENMKKKGETKMATERRTHRQREKKDSEQEKRDRKTKKGSDLDKETKKGGGGAGKPQNKPARG